MIDLHASIRSQSDTQGCLKTFSKPCLMFYTNKNYQNVYTNWRILSSNFIFMVYLYICHSKTSTKFLDENLNGSLNSWLWRSFNNKQTIEKEGVVAILTEVFFIFVMQQTDFIMTMTRILETFINVFGFLIRCVFLFLQSALCLL